MSNILAKAGIAAMIAFGAISAFGPTASAGDLGAWVQTVRYDPHGARICSPVLAVQKARGTGMRYASIGNITPRRVVVEGRNRGGPDRIVFANLPGCPLIRR
jgi:hypothetical protein